jgi:hypothetical protein
MGMTLPNGNYRMGITQEAGAAIQKERKLGKLIMREAILLMIF